MSYFEGLVYSMGDEDTTIEYKIMPDGVDTLLCVLGSGGRFLPLLSKKPKNAIGFDFSGMQVALSDYRLCLARDLNYKQFLSNLGYREGEKDRLLQISMLQTVRQLFQI